MNLFCHYQFSAIWCNEQHCILQLIFKWPLFSLPFSLFLSLSLIVGFAHLAIWHQSMKFSWLIFFGCVSVIPIETEMKQPVNNSIQKQSTDVFEIRQSHHNHFGLHNFTLDVDLHEPNGSWILSQPSNILNLVDSSWFK